MLAISNVIWVFHRPKGNRRGLLQSGTCPSLGPQKDRGRFQTCPYNYPAYLVSDLSYAFPASFNVLRTFSGLSGNFLMRTPVAL